MQNTKRIIIATLSGILFGFVCFGLASIGSLPIAWPVAVQIILSRALIGLAIGISFAYLGHWAIHGLAMGLVFSLPLAFKCFLLHVLVELRGKKINTLGQRRVECECDGSLNSYQFSNCMILQELVP